VGDANIFGAPPSGVQGKHPRRDFFFEIFLVKYCNFIVNLDHSLLGLIYDGIIYVGSFFPYK
jgi:hypothetical protein